MTSFGPGDERVQVLDLRPPILSIKGGVVISML